MIDTQIARDVVKGDAPACAEMVKRIPIGRAGRPEEIASIVLWLCSQAPAMLLGRLSPWMAD